MPLVDRQAELDDDFGAVLELDVAHAEPAIDVVRRNDQCVARSGRDVDPRALADEIVAEPFDLDVGDDAALVDLGIDERTRPRRSVSGRPAAAGRARRSGPCRPPA